MKSIQGIIDRYKIIAPLKESRMAKTFCVENDEGKKFFLKAFNVEEMSDNMFSVSMSIDEDGFGLPKKVSQKEPTEIAVCKVQHLHLLDFKDQGTWHFGDKGQNSIPWPYMITEWVDGMLLSDYIELHRPMSWTHVLPIVESIAEALKCLHAQGWAHNDLTPHNVMIAANGDPRSVKLIDMAHTSLFIKGNRPPFIISDLDPYYSAPETNQRLYDASTDVFSLAALLYTIVEGHAPWWNKDTTTEDAKEILRRQREEPIAMPSGIPYCCKVALFRALYLEGQERLTLDDFCATLRNEFVPELPPLRQGQSKDLTGGENSPEQMADDDGLPAFGQLIGPGFQAMAGLREIRLSLTRDIIFVLKNIEKARRLYHIELPNGLLLWGPKGCGKTYISTKFAEESGLNFAMVRTSDLLSDSETDSSQRLAALFKKAQAKAPAVICFDEIDALTTDREKDDTPIFVNEFLSQLNNCGERGIFVIGTTNRPDKIDPSFLRTGRFDKIVYVPVPDLETRKGIFELYLKGRLQAEIDATELAEKTAGYTASDIESIVNQASIFAFYEDKPITQQHLLDAIASSSSSISADEIQHYEDLKNRNMS